MTLPAQPAPTAPRAAPAKPELDLNTVQRVRATAPLELPQQVTPLPPEVQSQVNIFWAALKAAEGAYDTLAKGYPGIWESVQYPVEYRQQQAEAFMDAVFAKQRADLDSAAAALQAARDAVRLGLTPPALGDPTTHELKLLNAREEVKLALEDVQQPGERLEILLKLFKAAVASKREPGMVYLLGATDTFRRLIRDEFTQLEFAGEQEDMLKQILPPEAAPYFTAGPVLDELERVLEQAEQVRGFTAQDNGLAVVL